MHIVYMMHKDIWKQMPEDLFRTLFPYRYEKSEKFVFADDKNRCIGAGVLLYKVLGLTEKDISYNACGKPYAVRSPQFSLSHSGDYVVLAHSSAETGVDIEKVDEKYMDIMPQVFSEEEISYVNNDPKCFYQIWTLKESLAKAVGEGLQMPLREVSVLAMLSGKSIRYKGKNWFGYTTALANETYVLSGVKSDEITADMRELRDNQRRIV